MTDFDHIPVLDVSPIHGTDPDAMGQLADAFLAAYGSTGFAYIVGHGIASSLIDDVFAASRRFHALPSAVKMTIELDQNHRGFIPIDTSTDVNSTLADITRPNQSESFMMMREDGPDAAEARAGDFLAGANQWPELDGFRATVTAYHDALCDLGGRLMRVALQSIGSAPDALDTAFARPTTWLRLLHYPPTDPLDGDDLFGSAPHTDFGCLTILAQDDVGGLQVRSPSGKWVDAPFRPGAFVVNVGDMLHRWSNGLMLSTPHRVINRSGRERFSCPFFFDPNVKTDIAPLASTVAPDAAPRFESVNFEDFLRSELQAGYDAHKSDNA